MFAEITAAINSLKVAGDIAKGLISLQTTTEIQAKAIELNEKIISAQHSVFAANAAQSALVDEVGSLKAQIVRMENWGTQKQRYKLVTLYPGSFAYALKKAVSEGEPSHYICANCYENGKRSIMQATQKTSAFGAKTCFVCRICGSEANCGMGPVVTKYAEDFAST
jgi:hypothetical protein